MMMIMTLDPRNQHRSTVQQVAIFHYSSISPDKSSQKTRDT